MKLIHGAEVLYQGTLQKKDVLFDENSILKIADKIEAEAEIIHGEGLTLLPGLVDVHVHFRQPGQPQKETIRTGSLAAAHGGFTSVFAMPNVHPYPDNASFMKEYMAKLKSDSCIHTYGYGTISKGEKGEEISDLEGMYQLGTKWFSDDGVGMNNSFIMQQALRFSEKTGVVIACHTEDMKYRHKGASVHDGIYAEKNGWIGIPDECESEPLKHDLAITQVIHGKYHACHISSHLSTQALRKAKANGADASGEVTAHHLLLEDKDVRGPMEKMNPPLRTHADRMALIEALEDGTLDFIASDHAPHTMKDKDKPMAEAAFGIVSLETSFSLLYTEFVRKERRWTLNQLVQWMSEKPAARFGLSRTGRIEEGWKSDMVLVDLQHETMINPDTFLSKGKNTPFAGWSVWAKVVKTIVDGQVVFEVEE